MFKITGLNHVGIAVTDLDATLSDFKIKFGLGGADIVDSKELGLKMGLINTGNCILELMEPKDKNGTVAKFLEKQGRNAIHHIAFSVDSDLDEVSKEMKRLGVEMLYPKSVIGVLGHPVNFCHPKFTSNILVELCDVGYESRRK
ncbi:MAG: VOC family protein [Thaumarchaeota archaeon]|nr:VOC family protein [Nitrososphaerota archaeon]